ncbi:MAG: NADH-quinone oxidoreductase subunit [Verrucomicrobiota bacterium]
MRLDYAELFRALRPEALLVFGALLALGLDLAVFRARPREARLRIALWIGALAIVAALAHAWLGVRGPVFGGVLLFDRIAVATRLGVLVLTLLTLGVTAGGRTPRHPVEHVAIVLFAATGFLLMAAANQLLLAFLALELASVSLYVLAGFDKSSPRSAEAGLKYFLTGGISAAFLLFGFSLLYGITGSIELAEIGKRLAGHATEPLTIVAVVMVVAAFGFKAAAAPFHLWAPDAYEGAPAPSAALIASAAKLAGLVLFWRLLWSGLGGAAGDLGRDVESTRLTVVNGWMIAVALLAFASMAVGNLGALAQRNVRRLLAYSAIAHAGVLVLGVIATGPVTTEPTVAPLFYYAATYGLATVGAFGVIAVVARAGRCEELTDLAGLHRRSPLLAGCLAVCVLSLAGIPPLAGFLGKFWVILMAFRVGGAAAPLGWIGAAAVGWSAVGLYYYLLVLKQALVAAPTENAPPLRVPPAAAVALVTTAALLIVAGVWPDVVLRWL